MRLRLYTWRSSNQSVSSRGAAASQSARLAGISGACMSCGCGSSRAIPTVTTTVACQDSLGCNETRNVSDSSVKNASRAWM
jgi:hypothetical protein